MDENRLEEITNTPVIELGSVAKSISPISIGTFGVQDTPISCLSIGSDIIHIESQPSLPNNKDTAAKLPNNR